MNTNRHELNGTLRDVLLSMSILCAVVFWVEKAPAHMHTWLTEDGPIENTSAVFFGLASLGFLAVAVRSRFLREKKGGLRYAMVISWSLLMFVFMGEEISWGQRIFGFQTPETLAAINLQSEFNIHNIEVVDTFMGGKYRYLSLMMLTTGLLLPLLALTPWGRRTIQWWAFPVTPIGYAPIFIGAYIFGKYYYDVTLHGNDATETREFLLSVGMLLFALKGALKPCELFRVCTAATALNSEPSEHRVETIG